jgi:ABC-type oligopeptide transport system ATPase subunit
VFRGAVIERGGTDELLRHPQNEYTRLLVEASHA